MNNRRSWKVFRERRFYKLEFDLISMINMLPLSAICSN